MSTAKVFITEPAEHDINEIEYYIGVKLCNESAARNTIDGIINVIFELKDFPLKHARIHDSLLAALGIRLAWYNNYNIFYVYDEHKNDVHVLRVLSDRMDWRKALLG